MSSLGSYSSRVNRSGKSSRTTIPMPVAKALALAHKDEITWEIRVDEKGMPFVMVRKASSRRT